MNILSLLLLCIFHVLVSFGMQEPQEITSEQLPNLIDALPVEMWAQIIAFKFQQCGGILRLKKNMALTERNPVDLLFAGPNKYDLVLNGLGRKKHANTFEHELNVLQSTHKLLYNCITQDQNYPYALFGLHPLKNKFCVLRDNEILSYRVNAPDVHGLTSLNKKHTLTLDTTTVPLARNFIVYDLAYDKDRCFLSSPSPLPNNSVVLVSIKKENENVVAHNLLTVAAVKKACGIQFEGAALQIKVTHLEFFLAQRSLFLLQILLTQSKEGESNDNASTPKSNSPIHEKPIKTLLCRRTDNTVEVLRVMDGAVSWDQPDDYQRNCSFIDKTPSQRLLILQDPVDCAVRFVEYYKNIFKNAISSDKEKE